MIDWRTTVDGYSAALSVGPVYIARLHATPTGWTIEHLEGTTTGGAGSVGQAKRAALQALGALLDKATFEVDVALRSS